MEEITWDWNRTLWTERNRQRWAPEFLAAFQVYRSETHIRACRDPRLNFETGTSWVTLTLDMYCTEQLLKETRWKDPERKEEEQRRTATSVRDLGFALWG